jgi:hypothetical protein
MSPQYSETSHDVPKSEIWIRSGGKCECTSACEHHKAGRCGLALLPEFWSAHDILPAWIGASKSVLMFEASCEACRVNPAIRDQISEAEKRADPNWWYCRRPTSRSHACGLAA